MKTRILPSLVAFASILAACSSESGGDQFCGRVNECAKKSGAAFSESSCKNELRQAQEEADTSGCGDEYAEYMDCVGALELECSADLDTLVMTECGAKVKKAASCIGAGGGAVGKNPCEQAADRIDAHIQRCGGTVPPPSDSDGDDGECTEADAQRTTKAANDFEAHACDDIVAVFPPR